MWGERTDATMTWAQTVVRWYNGKKHLGRWMAVIVVVRHAIYAGD